MDHLMCTNCLSMATNCYKLLCGCNPMSNTNICEGVTVKNDIIIGLCSENLEWLHIELGMLLFYNIFMYI